jgi:uncharacterized protein YndB with AHSA1/START domain
MTASRHGSATVTFPSDREIVITRLFDAPMALVFEALTNPEHVRHWFGAGDLEVCEIDLRVGGAYHYVGYVMEGDTETCSFRGTYLEIEAPTRTKETWGFDGWPQVQAVETVELSEDGGVTTVTITLEFPDRAARDTGTWVGEDGVHADRGGQVAFDRLEDRLAALRA